jgi:hypothetical protein
MVDAMTTKNAIIVAVAFVIAAILWFVLRPRDQWFPGASNRLGIMLIVGGVVAGVVVGLVVKAIKR